MAAKILSLNVNGQDETILCDGLTTLQEVLRDQLGLLTSVKDGCTQGGCGSCSVLVDGELWLSCLAPVAALAGRAVMTLEGLKQSAGIAAIQQSFIDNSAAQCGFCTPGMILTVKALLDANPEPSHDEILEALSGNLCRCTGYLPIIEAVKDAAARLSGGADAARASEGREG